MMEDEWYFGLRLLDGTVICITHIDAVSVARDGTIWLKVRLMEEGSGVWLNDLTKRFTAPTDRTTASINASHIVAAFEVANT
jgi:hypothetical protein